MRGSIFFVCLLLYIRVGAQTPKVFVMDAARLQSLKSNEPAQANEAKKLRSELQKRADSLLSMKPVSVMEKAFTPVSGSKHDYMSQAPYFWYDSTKPNGLPYMRRDGVRNPEIYKITDRSYLGQLENATKILALAWYTTGDEKYAAKAAELLRHWFLDEDTKMNPHLEYGQAIPGVNTGRGIGIIETRSLIGIADAAGLLEGSKSWKETDSRSLQQWYAQYLNWLLTSKNGIDEHAAKNNHGTWYYAQVIDFALFSGNKAKAKELVEESKKRLDSQLTAEGKQPLELERTNALGYSTMNLSGWFTVARLAEKTGVDLWNYKTSRSVSMRTALDWLEPYAMGEKKWEYQQISRYNKDEFYPLLLQAADKFKDPAYLGYIKTRDSENNGRLFDLLYGN
jgi:Alginate lyase